MLQDQQITAAATPALESHAAIGCGRGGGDDRAPDSAAARRAGRDGRRNGAAQQGRAGGPGRRHGAISVPARAALERAATVRKQTGTENRGFLSEEHGLLPVAPPRQMLPDSHRVWDEIAARLPELFRSVTGREALEARPRRTLDHLEVLTPTMRSREERVFYMAQVEILAGTAAMIGAMARAQEAAAGGEESALATELATLIDGLDTVTHDTFLKIDSNPHSPTYIDPVVWAKTVAPFAVAIDPGKHAVSGAAAPPFQVLDVFIGRRCYASRVGSEARGLRPGFSQNLREFIEALEAMPVGPVVARGSARLRGLWRSLLETYCGDRGFLGVHRRKAYAFLEIAFKVGRSVTTGGFSGEFDDQTWIVADRELEASRLERWDGVKAGCPVAHSLGCGPLGGDGLAHVRLDVSQTGLRFRPGDRLAVLPRNSPALVARTVGSLAATGEEPVRLDDCWRAATGTDVLALRELVARGRIRPLVRAVATALAACSRSDALARIVAARSEGDWELWDVLALLTEHGFDPRVLWQADPREPHALARLVPPETFRQYSLASAMDGEVSAEHVDLLAAQLRYTTPGHDGSPGQLRSGTASSYLSNVARSPGDEVAVRVVPSLRFRLPTDATQPIVMFAGGAGISAFRSFLDARRRTPAQGDAWLFLSTRSQDARDRYAREAQGVRFRSVVTGAQRPEAARTIGDLIAAHASELAARAADSSTAFFVCGPAGFATAVIDALEALTSRQTIREMLATGRLQQDIFTSSSTPPPATATFFDASEIAEHNDDAHGLWTILDGAVYDLTEFGHRHPGGAAILRQIAGRDGTAAYRQIGHHLDPSVESMLPTYHVGRLRKLEFGQRRAPTDGEHGPGQVLLEDAYRAWVRYLHLVVEIENSLRADFAVLDATLGDPHDTGEWSLMKAQLLLETQQRFQQVYLRLLLGDDLQRLWPLSSRIAAAHKHAPAMQRALALPVTTPHEKLAAKATTAPIEQLRSIGHADPATRLSALRDLAALRSPLLNADLTFLAGLKHSARTGVRLFEVHERATSERAGQALLEPLREIPRLVDRLHEMLADAGCGPAPHTGSSACGA